MQERQRIFDEGYQQALELDLIPEGVEVIDSLDTFKVGVRVGKNDWVYGEFGTREETLAFLTKNPAWFAVDGVYHERSLRVELFATATASGTRLFVPAGGLLSRRLQSGLAFNTSMNGVENVIQTIAHETGHHFHFNHDTKIYNREYRAVKRYRAR